jgi:hypothetical protein
MHYKLAKRGKPFWRGWGNFSWQKTAKTESYSAMADIGIKSLTFHDETLIPSRSICRIARLERGRTLDYRLTNETEQTLLQKSRIDCSLPCLETQHDKVSEMVQAIL